MSVAVGVTMEGIEQEGRETVLGKVEPDPESGTPK